MILNNSPFEQENIFGYKNGDLGLIKKVLYNKTKEYRTYLVILLKDFNEYHIPNTYMKRLEDKC